jgi:Flp pilus assembly protein TadG
MAKRATPLGSSLAELPVGLALVIFAMITALFVFMDVWQLLVYKQKLVSAASEGAQAAADVATVASWSDSFSRTINKAALETLATDRATSTLSMLRVPTANVAIDTSLDGRMVKVTLKGTRLPLLAGWIFPSELNVEESAAAPVRIVMPDGLMTLTSSVPPGAAPAFPVYGTDISPSGFVRHNAEYSLSSPSATFGTSTLGSITDPGWLNWSPVYPN